MKTLTKTLAIAISLLTILLSGENMQAQHKLTIVIDGIEKQKGKLFVAVYDETSFLKQHVYGAIVKADSDEITVVLDSIQPKDYAISIFHDENDNNKLDTGTYGIPTEKMGFSNNAKMQYGPPKFSDCKFSVDEDMVIYVTLK